MSLNSENGFKLTHKKADLHVSLVQDFKVKRLKKTSKEDGKEKKKAG